MFCLRRFEKHRNTVSILPKGCRFRLWLFKQIKKQQHTVEILQRASNILLMTETFAYGVKNNNIEILLDIPVHVLLKGCSFFPTAL